MGQIFPRPQMPLEQKCLLLYWFNKIIENDLATDSSGCKELWFEKWRMQVNAFLISKKEKIEQFNVLRNPDDAFADIVENLDPQVLFDVIVKQKSNLTKSWELDLFGQCVAFDPYDWFDLLLKEKRRERKWHEKLYKKLQTLCPKLTLNQGLKDNTLKEIAKILHVEP